jgi:hypothetical protein
MDLKKGGAMRRSMARELVFNLANQPHSSLKTTMIYTHCVPVRTIKEAKSPLDL